MKWNSVRDHDGWLIFAGPFSARLTVARGLTAEQADALSAAHNADLDGANE